MTQSVCPPWSLLAYYLCLCSYVTAANNGVSSAQLLVCTHQLFLTLTWFSWLVSHWNCCCLHQHSYIWLKSLSDPRPRFKVEILVQPTVSSPVCLGIRHSSVTHYQILITVRQLWVCWCGTSILGRGWVCSLQLLLSLASTAILRPEPHRTQYLILLSYIWYFPKL
jgi:hypothetical protein